MLAKLVIQIVNNSTTGKLGRKLDEETRQMFFDFKSKQSDYVIKVFFECLLQLRLLLRAVKR